MMPPASSSRSSERPIGRIELLAAGDASRVHAVQLPISVLGRRQTAEVFVEDGTVSQNHAAIAFDGRTIWLRDLLSRNGTFVGDQPVAEKAVVDRDMLRFGGANYRLRVLDKNLTQVFAPYRRADVALTLGGSRGQQMLEAVVNIIGSNPHADVVIHDPAVASIHALMVRTTAGVWLHDMASATGSYVNGKRADQTMLQSGDVVRVGETQLHVGIINPGSAAETDFASVLFASKPEQGDRDASSTGMDSFPSGDLFGPPGHLPEGSASDIFPEHPDLIRQPPWKKPEDA